MRRLQHFGFVDAYFGTVGAQMICHLRYTCVCVLVGIFVVRLYLLYMHVHVMQVLSCPCCPC